MNENEYNQKLAKGEIEIIEPAVPAEVGSGENPIGLWGKLLPFVYGPIKTILVGGSWKSWTPVWTNLTVGNGTVVAKYTQIGKTIHARISFAMGSTSSISGLITFSLPVAGVIGGAVDYHAGSAYISDYGISSSAGFIRLASTTTAYLVKYDGSSTSATVPITWGTNDFFQGYFTYEAA